MPGTRSSRERTVNMLGALSLVVADRVNASAEKVTAMGPSAPAALAALHEFLDGGSVTQLSSVLGLTHSGTVRLVDRLYAEGLVERAGSQDGRAVSVVLTRSGRRMATRVLQARRNSLDTLLSGATPAEIGQLLPLLEKLLAAVTRARAAERSSGDQDRPPPWLCRLCDFDACGRSEGNCPVNNAVTTLQREPGAPSPRKGQ
jgi:MarR family transcriptional regulator, negative regulator of the multidrug operon emrRAB